ncbi:g-protein coupled receptor GRL101 [Caerostris extrusa]|uniref:G-protein coupled receptor GRL101 n=1 Tax=Caerostris extrusa TaxID=172846 RepID=A0AAV4Q1J4_CAEEX|nr:g-protein coupled receptor GRL101 [Caerostris extrusa]
MPPSIVAKGSVGGVLARDSTSLLANPPVGGHLGTADHSTSGAGRRRTTPAVAVDEGYLEDKEILPVKEVKFGFTYDTGQYGYHVIGPLECFGNANDSNEECTNSTEYMKCNTGHYVNITYRCLYGFDAYGYHKGCRDNHTAVPDNSSVLTKVPVFPVTSCVMESEIAHMAMTNFCAILSVRKLHVHRTLCVVQKRINATVLPHNLYREVRKLDFSFNDLDLTRVNFSDYGKLGELILQYNDITILPSRAFLYLKNLYKLDLSHNNLILIDTLAFAGLKMFEHSYWTTILK